MFPSMFLSAGVEQGKKLRGQIIIIGNLEKISVIFIKFINIYKGWDIFLQGPTSVIACQDISAALHASDSLRIFLVAYNKNFFSWKT